MAVVAAVVAVAGAALAAIGSISQGLAEGKAAKFSAKVAERNAGVARDAADKNAEAARRKRLRVLGSIRAASGAQGFTSSEGNPIDIIASNAAEQKLEELNIRHQGELTAISFEDEAKLLRFRGKNAVIQGFVGAASQLFKGAGSAISTGAFSGAGGAGGSPGGSVPTS